jgi:hypothetical protein
MPTLNGASEPRAIPTTASERISTPFTSPWNW